MRSNGKTLKWMTGIAVGGGLMYLADPDRGNRRRALAREKFVHGAHVLGTATDKALRDLRNRARGTIAETWALARREHAGDEVLIDRVRAKIGRAVSHPNSIEVTAEDGRVTLSGPVLEREAEDLIEAVASVRGVRDVESRLETHATAENVAGLQGKARIRKQRPELLQEYWAPGTRLLAGVGGALALAFPARNQKAAIPSRVIGGLLVARAITNLPLRRMFGFVRGRRAIRFQKTVTIHEPVERVFELWSNPENFSRIMSHVQEVKKTGDNRFRWTVSGPAGTSATWESRITELEPNQLLAWRSTPGSLIRNAGIIRFESTADGATRVHLLLSYGRPAGGLGHALATLFGVGPKKCAQRGHTAAEIDIRARQDDRSRGNDYTRTIIIVTAARMGDEMARKNISDEQRAAKASQRRESGRPGGGQGRKDEVGRSGVYPMSGPHPPGAAEVRMAGAWGQGERGVAGYEDHGSSQLTFEGGQLLGALETRGNSLAALPETGDVEIPAEEWMAFLNSFSRQHRDWLANITITQGKVEQTEVRKCRLQGISSDHLSARAEIYLSVDQGDGGHITHSIKNPMKVIFQRNLRGAHEGLEVTSADGTLTRIRFRIAARPETLDGVLEESPREQARVASRQRSSPRPSSQARLREVEAHIPIERTTLEGNLVIPADARGIVLFAHGSGSSRHSPRNRYIAEVLQNAGFGTLLMDLLTTEEENLDEQTAAMRFDIDLLARRLIGATWWLVDQSQTTKLPIGYFGASTGAAAALVAAADESDLVSAIVSRGGRPDLAGAALHKVIMPTLLIVGGKDTQVIELNRNAFELIPATKKLEIVPGASHLFEEPGALESVAAMAKNWFGAYLARTTESGRAA